MNDTLWPWIGFNVFVLAMLALDLGVFHRKSHVVAFREAIAWTIAWVTLAFLFALGVWHFAGAEKALAFTAGYLIEYSLSVDNIFVFALLFSYFAVPAQYQHRVLFWGILGAAAMRALFLFVGIEAIERWHWTIYLLGGLLIATGVKLLLQKDENIDPEKNFVLRLARRYISVTDRYDGSNFFTYQHGRRYATPLFLALLVVETTDVLFAVDSVPAALGISKNLFVVYTSNIFAILGLRSLFFAVGGLLKYLHYLKYGLSLILIFVGVKMLVSSWSPIPVEASLGVVAGILLLAVIASMVRSWIVGKEAEEEVEEMLRGAPERRNE